MTDLSEALRAEASPSPAAASPVDWPLYPIGLVMKGRRCLVVGGGVVAGRKLRSLLECGAEVTMVAPDARGALGALRTEALGAPPGGPSLDVQLRRYERGDAAGYQLVIAATGDPQVDAAVYEDADAAAIWVNSADDPAHCSAMLPAVWRAGPVTVAVSTNGTSPALASWLRTRLAECMGEHVGQLAILLGEARRRVQDDGRSTGDVDWLAILDGPVVALVAEGRLSDASAVIGEAVARPESEEARRFGHHS